MTRKEPIKDCVVSLRCDHTTKEFLEHLAESTDVSVSHLVFRLIQSGAKLERERRSKLYDLMNNRPNEFHESPCERERA
jgi:hypothetical protein